MSNSSTSQLGQPKHKRYVLIICLSLVIGITAGVIISRFIHNTNQVKEAHTALTNFSSLLDEKRISKTVSAARKLAAHPQLIATVAGKKQPDNADALLILEHARFLCDTSLVYLLNAKGDVVACTPYANGTKTLTGNNYGFRPYFINPMQTAKVCSYPALGVTTGKRGIYFSAPVYQEGKRIGVVVIKIGLSYIDQELTKYPYPCALLTKDGVVFASNRQDWLFKTAYPLSAAKKEAILTSRQFADKPLTALPVDLQAPGKKLFFEDKMVIPSRSSNNFWGFSYISLFPLSSPPLLFTAQISLIATLSALLFLFTFFILIDRNRLFSSLKMREKDYHSIIENLKATFYRIDNNNRFIQVSPIMAELYQPKDCTLQDMIGCKASKLWKYPEKREEYLQALAQNNGRIRDFPCQLLRKDGSTADVVVNASYFFDENGKKQGIEGLIHDVSEILQLQQRLLLLDSAVQAASNSIVITDTEGIVLWINHAFTLLTGFTADDAVGKKMNILRSGCHDDSFYGEMWQTIKSGKNWFGEVINKRKDGSTYHEEMSITPVYGEDGNISNYIAIKNDISIRKKQEEEKENMLIREQILTQRIAEEKIKHSETGKMEKESASQKNAAVSVILITDNSFERLLIPELLSRKNIYTCCLKDSTEVAEKMKDNNYVLILLDMPFSTATPIIKEIHRQVGQKANKMPILLITAAPLDNSKQETAAFHVTDSIRKPIDPEQLFAKITQWGATFPQPEAPNTSTDPHRKTEYILDRKTGIKRVMGNEDLYEKLLKSFQLEFQDTIKNVIIELENGTLETAKRMIHTLKGASGGIGGDVLQKACEKMERTLAEETDQKRILTELNTLDSHLSDLTNQITPTEEINQDLSSKPDGSTEIICELYEQFGDAIQSGKFAKGQQLTEELTLYNWPEADFPDIPRLLQLLDSYIFDQAADLFLQIKQKAAQT